MRCSDYGIVESGAAEDRRSNGAYCPHVSVVMGDVIDMGESVWRCVTAEPISRVREERSEGCEQDDVPDTAPHSKLDNGGNHGATQAKNQRQTGPIQRTIDDYPSPYRWHRYR